MASSFEDEATFIPASNTPNQPPTSVWFVVEDNGLKVVTDKGLAGLEDQVIDALGPYTVDFKLEPYVSKFYPETAQGTKGEPYFVFSCDTQGTRLIPPVFDQELWQARPHRLAPLEEVTVSMGFSDANAELKARSPDGDMIAGDESKTVGFDFGAGFFGGDPTANIGMSWSKTNTMQLTDYLLKSNATTSHTQHTVTLRMLEGGYKYDPTWNDTKKLIELYEFDSVGTGLLGTGDGPPATAFEDRMLGFSGLWFLPASQAPSATFQVKVAITYPVNGHSQALWYARTTWNQQFEVPLLN